MIKFDPQNYPYPSKRNVVYARNGMCNAGNPHASFRRTSDTFEGRQCS